MFNANITDDVALNAPENVITELGGTKCHIPVTLVQRFDAETREWDGWHARTYYTATLRDVPEVKIRSVNHEDGGIIPSMWYEVPTGATIPEDMPFAIVEERGAEQVHVVFKPNTYVGAKHRFSSWQGPRFTPIKINPPALPPKPEPRLAMVQDIPTPVYVIVDKDDPNYGLLCSTVPDKFEFGSFVKITSFINDNVTTSYDPELDDFEYWDIDDCIGAALGDDDDDEWDTFDFRDEDNDE